MIKMIKIKPGSVPMSGITPIPAATKRCETEKISSRKNASKHLLIRF